MHVPLQVLEQRHVLGTFWPERIERAFVLADSMNAPFNSEPVDELVETEAGRDNADGANDGGGVGIDFIAGEGEEVAARGRDVLAEDVDPLLLLLGELPDAAEDQVGLHGRSPRRIDNHRHAGELRQAEGLLDRTGDGSERQARPQRRRHTDRTGEAQHRHREFAAEQAHRISSEVTLPKWGASPLPPSAANCRAESWAEGWAVLPLRASPSFRRTAAE